MAWWPQVRSPGFSRSVPRPPEGGTPYLNDPPDIKIQGISAAFSLVELLAVIAIIAILAVLLIPAMASITSGYTVTRQGQAVNDQFVLARQIATSRNRDVELRFITKIVTGQTNWATQLMELDTEGLNPRAVGRKLAFSDQMIINPDLSPILGKLPSASANGETWHTLRFRPNGRLAVQMSQTENYLTVQLRRENSTEPENYFTLQINPITGRVSTYRP